MPGAHAYFQNESTPIGRLAKSLPEQVAQSMFGAIRDGAIAPGERLKEETYAELFAVSRSTVREAMALLERRGVVERIPRYGVRVIVIDAEEIEEIFNIRAQLLGLAARLAVEKSPPGLAQQLTERAERLGKLAQAERTAAATYAALSIETQRLLINACPGKRLSTIYEGLSDQALWRYAIREKSISFHSKERRLESAAGWARLAQAVAQGDAEQAERAAKAVLQDSYRAVQSYIASEKA